MRWDILVRRAIRHAGELKLGALAVYLHLRVAAGTSHYCSASYDSIAESTGLDRTTVAGAVELLESLMLVTTIDARAGARPTHYKVEDMPATGTLVISRRLVAVDEDLGPLGQAQIKAVAEELPMPDKPKKEKVPPSAEAMHLAALLGELIHARDPGAKIHPGWAADIDRIHKIDGRGWPEIEAVLRWCQADSFWQTNILSGNKLRLQFTALKIKMAGPKGRPDGRRFDAERPMKDL